METFTGIVYKKYNGPTISDGGIAEVWTGKDLSTYVLVKEIVLIQEHSNDGLEFFVVVVRGMNVTDFVLSE